VNDIIAYLEKVSIGGNSLFAWALALAVTLSVTVVLFVLRALAARRLKKMPDGKYLSWVRYFLDAISKTKFLFILILALHVGGDMLELPKKADTFLSNAGIFALFIQAGFWLDTLYRDWYENYYKTRLKINPSAVTTLGALRVVVSAGIWVCALLLALDNIGVNVMTLVTGLGIGGIALALAVQSTLSDLLASLSIVLDKTFTVGDSLAVDEHVGTVENIGLKTTRLRSLSGEQLIFTNTNLLQSRIRNYGRMYQRRVATTIGVTYQTSYEMLEAIPRFIREAVEAQGGVHVTFERAHLKAYGAYSVDFEYVYFVNSPDYMLHMDIQQKILLALHSVFAQNKIDFAFPTQTLIIEKGALA
jgi:small-conductance mechanosensitive channel